MTERTRRPFLCDPPHDGPDATYPDGAARRACGLTRIHLYSVLLQVGLAVPPSLRSGRCALTAPFHPYLPQWQAVCSLWRYPWGHPRQALPGTLPFRSPDFPPLRPFEPASAVARPPDRGLCRCFRAEGQDFGVSAATAEIRLAVSSSRVPSTLAGRKRRWNASMTAVSPAENP